MIGEFTSIIFWNEEIILLFMMVTLSPIGLLPLLVF